MGCFFILSVYFEQMFIHRGSGWGIEAYWIICYLLSVSSGNLLLQIHVMRCAKISSIPSKA